MKSKEGRNDAPTLKKKDGYGRKEKLTQPKGGFFPPTTNGFIEHTYGVLIDGIV